ncbi:MAG: hypothetical protein LBG77_05545 [Dysgonamonadaceae bacterium]|jgi:hypothetical protein|nr:hypothetical protein [Dysgonamonadaceae bacterium]
MAYTTEQYEKLKNAIVTGTHSVSYGDKSVTYRSIDEMKEVLSIMESELFPERRQRRRGLVHFDRGFFSN